MRTAMTWLVRLCGAIVFCAWIGSFGCANKTKADCKGRVNDAANIAVIISDQTAKKEARAEAVSDYAELVKAASGFGCLIAGLDE